MPQSLLCDYCSLPVPARLQPSPESGESQLLYCCYGCKFAAAVTQARGEKGQANLLLTRLGVSVFLSMGVMVFSLALYSQDVYGLSVTNAPPAAIQLIGLFRYISLIMATPVFAMLGIPILVNATSQLRQRIVTTDGLVVLGVAGAFIYSYISTLSDTGRVYYETACMVLVLITLGRYLEATGRLKASDAFAKLGALVPDEVSVRRASSFEKIASDEVRIGDVLHIRAGERIAVDGLIEQGQAHIDEQMLTGESEAISKKIGDKVHAGTLNIDGDLHVRALAVGEQSAVGRLSALLELAKLRPGRYQRLADRVAGAFVPAVIIMAIIGAYLGYHRGGSVSAMMTALSVLLISCPCALGLATPMAIWIGLGRGAQMGVVFRDGPAIERLAIVRAIAFDKTGTLTTGQTRIIASAHADKSDSSASLNLSLATGLANASSHASSTAFIACAQEKSVTPATLENMKTIPGQGLTGVYKNKTIRLGSETYIREVAPTWPAFLDEQIQQYRADAHGLVCLSVDNQCVAVFALTETLREEAATAIEQLSQSHYDVSILSGDHAVRGHRLAEKLDVPVKAQLSPADKVDQIESLRREKGIVAMVGDGLNDAPALKAADVGIAMGCGADLSREAADVCLLSNDLLTLVRAMELSRRIVRTIKMNLFWAFAYNTIGIALAMTGILNPILAASAMVISSIFVVTNSLRLYQK